MIKKYFLFFVWGTLAALEPSICLCLETGESPTRLQECLASVRPIVDCISLCEAGAGADADAVIAAVEDFAAEWDIPCYIESFEEEPSDPLYPLQAGVRALKQASLFRENGYLLTLGLNDVLKVGSGFSKEALEDDSYLLLTRASSHLHFDLRLIRAEAAEGFRILFSDPASYRAPPFSTKLSSLMVEKGSLAPIERYEASARRSPKNGKALFALAQAYRDANRFDDAIRWYRARIDLGEGGEEVWFSKYRIGECLDAKGDWPSAMEAYLEAFQTDPKRPEPLLKVASHYRQAGMNEIAYLFAKHGSKIPFPEMRNLYPFLCNYQFDEGLSIAAYYTRYRSDGFEAASQLVLKRGVPGYIRDQTYRNLLFYVSRLPEVKYVKIDFDIPLIEGTEEKYHPMNPSIQKTQDGYKVPCRVVSYTQEGAKHFRTADPKGMFKNRNFLLSYDKEFRLLSQKEIVEDLPRERIPHFLLEGMEDCRLFELGKSLWFTATCFDTNPTGSLQIALCKLGDKGSGKEIKVEKLIPLLGPDPHRCEKNWLPFVKDGQLHLVYSYDPFLVYRPNLHTGSCETAISYRPGHEMSQFRGSASPLPFDGGYLLMIHEVVFMPDFTRCYLHRFLHLDQDLKIKSLTKPFLFDHAGVEFCCGMTPSHSGEELVMAIGLEDREARLGIIRFDTVRSLLEPLPPPVAIPFEE